MLLSRGFRNEQENKQTHRLLIGCIKTNRLSQLKDSGHGRLQALDAAMGNGNAMTQSRRAQSLTGKEAVSDQSARQPMQVLKEKSGFFECAFLAGGFNPDKNLGNRQYG